MKIYFLTGEFAPEFGGGIGTYVENCAKMFAKEGNDVTVIVRGNNETHIEETAEGYRVLRFKQGNKEYYQFLGYENALAYQYYEETMALIEKEGKPDIIEVQEYNAIGQYLIQNKYLLNPVLQQIPIVVHLHTPSFETLRINQFGRYELPFYWTGEMEKFCIKGADALLCPSQFLADILQPMTNTPINVINLPFDIEQEEIDKRKGNLEKTEKKTILYFGRTEYRKGVSQMLEQANHLWEKGLDFKIKIIGGDTVLDPTGKFIGEDLKKKYSNRIESDNLEFLNSIPHLDLIPHILSATAVTIPSLYENFPNTCIYSMWLGKPVLVSKSGGQAEMVQESGKNGFIFDWDVPNDCAEKMEELLKMEDEELEVMGQNARNRIYDLCNMDKNYTLRKEFFEKVIKQHNPRKEFPFINSELVKDRYEKKYDGITNLVSVVIPYYNLSSTIQETVESVMQSTYKNYEIVIVNDGSTKEETAKLEELYSNNDKVRIITIQNQGLANARNVGAMNAKGEFIAFLDADDKIDKTFYEKAVAILNTYENVSYVFSWVQYFEGNNAVWPTFNIQLPYLLCANMVAAFAVVRKNDFLNFGKNRKKMEYGMEDYDGWVSMASHGCLGVSIPERLNLYRVRKDSMSRKFNKKMRIYLYDVLAQNYPELYGKYSVGAYMLLMANGQPYNWGNPSVSSINDQEDALRKVEKLNKIINSKPGRIAKKVYRMLRINKILKI